MSLFKRLFKGAQGAVNSTLEDIADANLIPELEQQIRDSKKQQLKVNDAVAEIGAKVKLAEREIASLTEEMAEYKTKLKAVVEQKGKEDPLVAKVIEHLNSLKSKIGQQESIRESNKSSYEQLVSQKRVNEDSIKKMEDELESLKNSDTLIKAKEANAAMVTNLMGDVNSAGDAAKRLKEKQAAKMAKLDAQSEMSVTKEQSLDDELSSLGIGDNAGGDLDEWLS